jgi:cytochrome c peroxidase
MLFRQGVILSMGLVAGSACLASEGTETSEMAKAATGTSDQALSFDARASACATDPRVVTGMVSADVCIGADLFFRETFNGNGRSCATCHRVDRNMTIDPEFIARLPANDKLFIAEQNPALAGLEIPAVMRQFGLILENVDGFAPDPRTHFVLRSVPHTLSLATSVTRSARDPSTAPLERTGWGGDGAPGDGTLRDFQTGAITQHYTRDLGRVPGQDFRLATDPELDRIDAFMRGLGRTNELDLNTIVMSDAGAEAGRVKYLALPCNNCHQNAGANDKIVGGNFNFNTGVEAARHPALAAFPHDGGFGARVNADGSFGNGTFNVPPLIEAADTGPFFHTATSVVGASAHNTDVATTIEEAIAFYDSPAFNSSPSAAFGPIDMTETEIDNIGRFLRGLNASFNASLAVKQLDAVSAISAQRLRNRLDIQRELLRLANVELSDALRVLSAVPNLNVSSRIALLTAIVLIEGARVADDNLLDHDVRARSLALARQLVTQASSSVGTNLTYTIGDATVMF